MHKKNNHLPYPKAKANPVRKNRLPWYIFVCDIDLERKAGQFGGVFYQEKHLSNVTTFQNILPNISLTT